MRLVLVLIAWVLSNALAISNAGSGYDCALASFHPDYPKAVREACRRQR